MLGRTAFRHRWRSAFLRLERLEERATPALMIPSQVRHAYGFDAVAQVNGTTLTGAGQTIAIVDAYYDANAASDLATFDSNYSISPPPSFTQVNQTGGAPGGTQNSGWSGETALDIEWAHAIAPGAKILLVEAADSSNGNLNAAVDYARGVAGVSVVSMSWGGGESNSNSHFTTPSNHVGGVSFFAASGDTGGQVIYPSSSPDVLSVGGTSLTLSGGNYGSESAWSSGGGGPSAIFTKPSYQTAYSGTMRGTPDVSYDANPSTGFAVINGGTLEQVGGTSAAAPQWAALVAIADQGRALNGLLSLDGFSQLLPAIYSMPASNFHDITTGSNGYPATAGYDLATGLGTPKAQLVIAALVAYGNTGAPAITTQPINMTVNAGQPVTFTAGASGTPTPTVQWQVSTNGGATFTNISGATTTSYTSVVTAATDNGNQYRAVFTNGVGNPATTNAATLTVDYAPTVTTQPTDQSATVGQTATFTAAASGNPTPTVQWQLSTDGGGTFTNISGATSTSYSTGATVSTQNGYEYRAVFTNGIGAPATTNAATLTIASAPTVTTQPAAQSVTVGQTATFTAAADSNPAATVQWQVNLYINSPFYTNISGATGTTYSFIPTLAASGKRYRAVFTNPSGSTTSNAAPLTVAAPTTVAGVQVNDGSAQRSELRSITVTFSGPVTFAGGDASAAAAFQLQHVTDGNNVVLSAAVSTNAQGQTVVTLTFSGAETDSVSGQIGGQLSLADGRYTLTIIGGSVTDANGAAIDGAGTGTLGSNYVSPADTQGGGTGQLGLFRLFGDTNGDGIVDQIDLGQFRAANNSGAADPAYLAYLDADNSGTIDQIDLGQFRARNNSSVF